MSYDLLTGFWEGLKPIPILTVSEWADNNRYLTSESAAEPGQWKTSRTPYLKDIMDDLSPNSPVNEVIGMKGVQLGFSESALNVCGCYIDINPCPIMYVMPTILLAKAISEERLDPMIEYSPSLKLKVKPSRERDSGNTKFVKKFGGGLVVLSGANSAASLRSRPVKVLILDETDAYPFAVDNEGSPIALAEKRTTTFGFKKKIYKLSTPKLEGSSIIEREFLLSDQRYYFVPCPHCGHKQRLEFEQLKWDKGNYSSAQYLCIECACLIDERFKTKMLAGGEWIPTRPENKSVIKKGYHLNSLYSPLGWLSWANIVEQYEKSKDNVNEEIVFINTILGQTYKNKGEAPDWQQLYNKVETYKQNEVHEDVAFLTAGADVQKDRIEVEIVGWCKGKKSYSIDHRILPGQTSEAAVWKKLGALLNEQWLRKKDNCLIPLKLMAVDAGYNTSYVYDFCRKYDNTKVIPIFGKDNLPLIVSAPRKIETNRAGKKIGAVHVWNVGVSLIKSELYGWLRLEKEEDGSAPNGYCFFPQYSQEYFKGLVSEQLQFITDKKGRQKYSWVKKFDRNEPLDMRIYARAAAAVVGMDRFSDEHWEDIFSSYAPDEEEKPSRKSKEDDFWGGKGSYW